MDPEDKNKQEQQKSAVTPQESRKAPLQYEPEYYESTGEETQMVTNVIGWVIAFILLVLAVWLIWIALR